MKRAYVKYDDADTLTSGVLRTGESPPSGRGWVEVPASLCCSPIPIPAPTAGEHTLKGFIRFSKKGDVIEGSTILRKKRPRDGKWIQIPYHRCC